MENNTNEIDMDFIVEKARVAKIADATLITILEKEHYNFDQYAEVSKITDLEVAKLIIKRLLLLMGFSLWIN